MTRKKLFRYSISKSLKWTILLLYLTTLCYYTLILHEHKQSFKWIIIFLFFLIFINLIASSCYNVYLMFTQHGNFFQDSLINFKDHEDLACFQEQNVPVWTSYLSQRNKFPQQILCWRYYKVLHHNHSCRLWLFSPHHCSYWTLEDGQISM